MKRVLGLCVALSLSFCAIAWGEEGKEKSKKWDWDWFLGANVKKIELQNIKGWLVGPELKGRVVMKDYRAFIEGKAFYGVGDVNVKKNWDFWSWEEKDTLKEFYLEGKMKYFVLSDLSANFAVGLRKFELSEEGKRGNEKYAKGGVSYYLTLPHNLQFEFSPFLKFTKIDFEQKESKTAIGGQIGVFLPKNKGKISLFYEKLGENKETGINLQVRY
ncbi:MAG: hypothetical protein QW228_09045 [Candidatus Aenigmatarchaeota archaeon]